MVGGGDQGSIPRSVQENADFDVSRQDPLSVEPSPLELGTLDAGSPGRVEARVVNRSSTRRIVRRFDTSCSCVSVEPSALRLDPGAAASISVRFDPERDPDFRGALRVAIRGFDPNDAPILKARVRLEVR